MTEGQYRSTRDRNDLTYRLHQDLGLPLEIGISDVRLEFKGESSESNAQILEGEIKGNTVKFVADFGVGSKTVYGGSINGIELSPEQARSGFQKYIKIQKLISGALENHEYLKEEARKSVEREAKIGKALKELGIE